MTGVGWLKACFIVGLLVAVLKVDGDVVSVYPVDVLGVIINLSINLSNCEFYYCIKIESQKSSLISFY